MSSEMENGKIHILDTLTANRIAAGEVVERPANVIKELVENSIDSGATRIEVRIPDNRCEKITVIDNGCGMTPEDMRMSVIRHATSKISHADDLNSLSTLGFRGEALPSVAAVSLLTMTSKTPGSDVGYRMVVEDGKASIPEEVAVADGTTIVVDRLFYNTPARKKFLRTQSTEMSAIVEMFSNLALSHLDISFVLRRGNYRLVVTRGNGDLLQTITEVYGRYQVTEMLFVDDYNAEFDISMCGFTSLPEMSRSVRHYHFYVNGRPVVSPVLNAAVDEAYYTLMSMKRYPVVFLFLKLDPERVDVNVHPTKAEIRFRDPKAVQTAVMDILMDVLAKRESLVPRMIGRLSRKEPETARPAEDFWLKPPVPKSASEAKQAKKPPVSAEQEKLDYAAERHYLSQQEFQRRLLDPRTGLSRTGAELPPKEQEPLISAGAAADPASPADAGVPVEQSGSKANASGVIGDEAESAAAAAAGDNLITFPVPAASREAAAPAKDILRYSSLHIIGQYLGTYILAAGEKGLYMIDQHAAAERINYEKFSAEVAQAEMITEMLAVPEAVDLSVHDHMVLSEHIVDLRDMGFIVELFGDTSYLIRGVPYWYEGGRPIKLLMAAIDLLNESFGKPGRNMIHLRAEELFMASCKKSIKANRYLTEQDISGLLAQLDECQNSSTCPHGRPIAIMITEDEIRRRFKRSGK